MGDKAQYLTEVEVSNLTRMSLSDLRNKRHLGKGIPYIKCSRSVRYDLEDVIAYMEARKIHTSQD